MYLASYFSYKLQEIRIEHKYILQVDKMKVWLHSLKGQCGKLYCF